MGRRQWRNTHQCQGPGVNTQTTNYSARSSPAEQPPLSSPQISHILHNRDGMKQEFSFLLVEINWVFLITRFIRSSQIPKHRPEYLTIFNILYEPLLTLRTLRSSLYLLKIIPYNHGRNMVDILGKRLTDERDELLMWNQDEGRDWSR